MPRSDGAQPAGGWIEVDADDGAVRPVSWMVGVAATRRPARQHDGAGVRPRTLHKKQPAGFPRGIGHGVEAVMPDEMLSPDGSEVDGFSVRLGQLSRAGNNSARERFHFDRFSRGGRFFRGGLRSGLGRGSAWAWPRFIFLGASLTASSLMGWDLPESLSFLAGSGLAWGLQACHGLGPGFSVTTGGDWLRSWLASGRTSAPFLGGDGFRCRLEGATTSRLGSGLACPVLFYFLPSLRSGFPAGSISFFFGLTMAPVLVGLSLSSCLSWGRLIRSGPGLGSQPV